MSLIQEALKRQHEDAAAGGAAPAGAPPAAADQKAPSLKFKPAGEGSAEPPALPGSSAASPERNASGGIIAQLPHAPAEKPKKSRTPVIIGAAVLILVLAGVAVYFLAGEKIKGLFKKPPAPPPVVEAPKETPKVTPTPTNKAPEITIPTPTPPVASNITVGPPPPPPPPPPPKRIIWPILKVSGLVKGQRVATATINNNMLYVGDEIEGVKILNITSDAVTLQYKGETRVLRTGDTTLDKGSK